MEKMEKKRNSGRPSGSYKRISLETYENLEKKVKEILNSQDVDEYTDFYVKLKKEFLKYDYNKCLAFVFYLRGYTYKQIGNFFYTTKQNIEQKIKSIKKALK
jgi:hypothetical protein